MSCWIEIDQLVGERLSGDVTRAVTVIGRASSECRKILVTLGGELRSGANVGADGSWMANFWTHSLIGCSELVKVEARCESDPDCGTGELAMAVETEKDNCPPVTLVVHDAKGKTVDTKSAEALEPGPFVAKVLVPTGPGLSFNWMVDGQLRPGQDSELQFDLLAGTTRTVAVSVETDDPNCSPSDFFTLEGVPSDWPSGVEFEIRNSAGDIVDPDPCLDSGRYVIKVISPSEDDLILEYTWFVDGIEIPGKQRPFFSYFLPRGSEARILALVKPSLSPPLSGTLHLAESRSPRGDRPGRRPPSQDHVTEEPGEETEEREVAKIREADKFAPVWLNFWLAGFGLSGILAYWNLWWPTGAAVLVVYAIFLGVWIWRCCWPKARRYWECPLILQWHYLVSGALLILCLASFVLQQFWNAAALEVSRDLVRIQDGNIAVLLILAAIHLACLFAMGRIACRVPNILQPGTYPATDAECE